jgi:hypothetical protein
MADYMERNKQETGEPPQLVNIVSFPHRTRSPSLPSVQHEEFAWQYESGITRPVLILWVYDAQGAR